MNINTEHGGIFFYILLAIILLAGLTYVISQNNRGNTNVLTDEQARVAATEIIDYGNTVAAAVQKLRLRGCSDTEISFENNVTSSNYSNANSPIDNSCNVFDVAGGNINYPPVNITWLDGQSSSNFYGEFVFALSCVENMGTHPSSGDSCNTASYTLLHGDIIMALPWIKKEICSKINNIAFNSASIPVDTNSMYNTNAIFSGDYNVSTAHVNYASFEEKEHGCLTGSNVVGNVTSGRYGYYQVLIAR